MQSMASLGCVIAEAVGASVLSLAGPGDGGEKSGAAASVLSTGLPPMGELGGWAGLIVLLPLFGAVAMGLCAVLKVRSKLPAWITVGCLAGAFVATVGAYLQTSGGGAGGGGGGQFAVVTLWEWVSFDWGGSTPFVANFALFVDSLTVLWMLFVTGLATLIALYASEYMEHDVGPGYVRFFAAFNLFVFSMACLVMGDNLLMLFLGWEGVGLCSYLLIGYFYKKPAAVAASKKAFVVNRIGDLGLVLGIMLTYVHFGTIEYRELFPLVAEYRALLAAGGEVPALVQLIPALFMIGAFGKSAQLPLYVWLPDAMEGPTPVSALIHAATMVTAGVYLVARTLPMFELSSYALPIVAWVGTLTALVAATIGMAQFDIKRIMAYSTVSQLGFMFAGLAFLTSGGAAFHVFTHAFFKATLFLCCGAVMHGFAGQLDLRKLSGVAFMKGWGIVGIAMLIGCLNLAGFPFTAGYFSKDMILAEAFVTQGPGYQLLGWLLLLTAGLTAYYTFRVFFRVFVGPVKYEMGEEGHGSHDDGHGHGHGHGEHGDAHGHGEDGHGSHGGGHGHAHEPHAPRGAINGVLGLLALLSVVAAGAYFVKWVPGLVDTSTAAVSGVWGGGGHSAEDGAHGHGSFLGFDPHVVMYYVSAVIGFVGIGVAFVLHYVGRKGSETSRADGLVPAFGGVGRLARRKWMVDELYGAVIVTPLRVLSHVSHLLDKLLVDGLVNAAGQVPRLLGRGARTQQTGELHGYAARMVGGVVVVVGAAVVVWWMAGGSAGGAS